MRCLLNFTALSAQARARLQRTEGITAVATPLQQFLTGQHSPCCPGPVGVRHQHAAPEPDKDEIREPGNPKVKQIVEDILSLNLLEVADLTEIIQKRLGIQAGGFGPAVGLAQPAAQVIISVKLSLSA